MDEGWFENLLDKEETEKEWTPDEAREALLELGWTCEEGYWCMPSRRSPRCFSDEFVEQRPHFVGKWMVEIEQ